MLLAYIWIRLFTITILLGLIRTFVLPEAGTIEKASNLTS